MSKNLADRVGRIVQRSLWIEKEAGVGKTTGREGLRGCWRRNQAETESNDETKLHVRDAPLGLRC